MENRFTGRVALITGGGAGVGRAVALGLAREGAAVVLADRSLENAKSTAAEVQAFGGRAFPVLMDLARHEQLGPAVQAAVTTFGSLDILMNCAATMGKLKPLLEHTPEDWNEVLHLNLLGTVRLTQAAVKQMMSGGRGGAIVNVLAIQAEMPLPQHAPYAASKAALASFTRSLAVEFAEHGIRANGIAVGPVFTDSVIRALDLGENFAMSAVDAEAATLVGRMGRPEEVARVALFLASEDASYLAGAVLPVDGGRMLSRKPDPFLRALEPAQK